MLTFGANAESSITQRTLLPIVHRSEKPMAQMGSLITLAPSGGCCSPLGVRELTKRRIGKLVAARFGGQEVHDRGKSK
jgi:hypothetical protein